MNPCRSRGHKTGRQSATRTFGRVLSATFVLLALALMPSCQHGGGDELGIPTSIPSYYWNYYLRGIAYSLASNWQGAATDFEAAIGLRDGVMWAEPEEKKRTKTYGVHFLDDYYPHRELGICYFYLHRFDDAEQQLSASLEALPSSRAKLYLNKVRQAKLSQRTDLPRTPIHFRVELPDDGAYLNQPYVVLSGDVSGDQPIGELVVHGKPIFIELAATTIPFRERVSLASGSHKVRIVAKDLAGYTETWERDFVVDAEGPSVSISPMPGPERTAVKLLVFDNVGLADLSVEGQRIDFSATPAEYSAVLKLQPLRKVTVVAVDRAGNSTTYEAYTGDLMKAARETNLLYPDRRLAYALDLAPGRAGGAGRRAPALPKNQATDAPTRQIALNSGGSDLVRDTIPPRLELRPKIGERSSVTTEAMTVTAAVADSGFVDSIAFVINGQQEFRSLEKHDLVEHRVTQVLTLRPGDNELKITVRDRAGNMQSEKHTIERKMPYNKRQDLRITVQTLLRLRQQKEANPDLLATLTNVLDGYRVDLGKRLADLDLPSNLDSALLGSEYPRFNLVTRESAVMERLLLEMELAHSSLADYRAAIASGAMKPSEWLLEGTVSVWGGSNKADWTLECKVIDVETSRVILTEDMNFEGLDPDEVKFRLNGLVSKLLQRLPLHAAPVSSQRGNMVVLPLGRAHNIDLDYRFFFIPAEQEQEDFVDPREWENKWIQGKVVDVSDTKCRLEIRPPGAIAEIKANDLAVAR